jgi:hypothetical protein
MSTTSTAPASQPSGVTRATTARQAAVRAGVILAQAELAILAALAKAILAIIGGTSFLLAALAMRRSITAVLAQARLDLAPLIAAGGRDARADVQRVITAELGPLARLLPMVPLPSLARLTGDLNKAFLTVTQSATAELERIARELRGLDGPAARVRAQALLDEITALTALRDRSGRRWSLPAYGTAAISGAVARAHLALQLHAYADAGIDLVLVVRHSASAPCPKCAPWVGKLLSVTSRGGYVSEVAGTVAEAVRSGLLHPSCRDSLGGWQDGADVPGDIPHAPGWAAAQRQRYKAQQERTASAAALRQARRQHALAITPLARTRARRLIRHLHG